MSGDRRRSAGRDLPIDLSLNLSPVAYDAAAFEPSAVMGSAAEELMVRRLVWGFSCQVVLFGLLPVLCSERGSAFFVPSPAIRFPERAEGVKGPKR